METPNDNEGLRTEQIMKAINREIYNGEMETSKYNRMYEVVYKTQKAVSTANLIRILREMGTIHSSKAL